MMKRDELNSLSDELLLTSQVRPHPVRVSASPRAKIALPRFSGAELVGGINTTAKEMGILFEEASYALDSPATMPYKRYRVSLKTKAGYSEIRRFIPALSAELPHVSLDSIRCMRPDLAAATLECELAFSAFYSRLEDE